MARRADEVGFSEDGTEDRMKSATARRGGLVGSWAFLLAVPVLLLGTQALLAALDMSTPLTQALALAFVTVPLACLLDWRLNGSPLWLLVLQLSALVWLQWWFVLWVLNRLAAQAGPGAVLHSAPPLATVGAFLLHAVLPVASLIGLRLLLSALSRPGPATRG
jgi:hypothetical protein